MGDLLWALHEDPQSRVRVYAFELWDAKDPAKLLAVTFGIALGRWSERLKKTGW